MLALGAASAVESSCQLAIPRYGAIQCLSAGINEPRDLSFNCSTTGCSASFTCVSECSIKKTDINLKCGDDYRSLYWTLSINGEKKAERTPTSGEPSFADFSFYRGQTVSVTSHCIDWQFKDYPVSTAKSKVGVSELRIVLKEGWAGSLPDVTIPESVGCNTNAVIGKYVHGSDVSTYLNPATGTQETKPKSTYSTVSNAPTNWKVDDNYVFVKDWQTGIADISLTRDKNNRQYWCGGTFGRRKIYEVNQINTSSGACYAIPTSIALSDIQCCFPSDCIAIDPSEKLTCNPDNWKCEETKPCNSELDCQQTFGSGVCSNKQLTSWTCDATKKWGDFQGTCIKSIKTVPQCSSDCTTNQYYDESTTTCKNKVTFLECPPGNCCKEGGSYKPKECGAGLTCCVAFGSFNGECKASCESNPNLQNSGVSIQTGQGQQNSKVNPVTMIKPTDYTPIVAGVILFGLVGAGYYLYSSKKTPKHQVEESAKCGRCGAHNSVALKFCSKCGNKF